MSARPEWLERYRVKNIFRNRRNKKAVYVDKERNVVDSTHFNLHGGTYSVPINLEQSFLDDYVQFIFGAAKGQLALTEKAKVSPNGTSFSSVFLDIDLKYPLHLDALWTYDQLEKALKVYIDVLYRHTDVLSLGTDQRVWIMECPDHPLLHTENCVPVNRKSGIHVHFPDLAMDRRKLLEVRAKALEMTNFFIGSVNEKEDIFDANVYKVYQREIFFAHIFTNNMKFYFYINFSNKKKNVKYFVKSQYFSNSQKTSCFDE